MKIKTDSFAIVVAGKWNKYILSPGWVAKNIFEETQVQVEFALNLDLPPRYTSSNIRLIPTEEKVIFLNLKPEADNFEKMENMVIKLLDILPYTPVSAFGINYGFVEDSDKMDLYKLFNLPDNDQLSAAGCTIVHNSVRHRLIVEDRTLNLTIKQNGATIDFDFNFHSDVTGALEAKDKIKGNFIRNKSIAENLLKTVYKLDYDTTREEIA